ncbi:hypothetical protein ILYODFUR_022569 [Ilyodon furcidens]|uniref:Uncharacterized protein n=1 Tax=Ilyodon furcidens TaxID=33524 RepID=A0ABV0TAN0_9TELE
MSTRLQREAAERSSSSRCDKQEAEHRQSLTEVDTFYKKKLAEVRTALARKHEELTSFKNRMAAEFTVSSKPAGGDKKNLPADKAAAETEVLYGQKLDEATSALKQKEEEVKSLKQRLQEAADVRSSPQRCKPQGCEHKESLTEMEAFYKKKLNEARSAATQKEKELKSVKDRLAGQVAISIKTGDTESMNNPVSKTRLIEMYDNLKLLQWPKTKDRLKSRNISSTDAKDLIQKTFGDASEEMKRRKQQIEEMFQQSSSGMTPQKIKEYIQLTVQNLQMALFHSSKEDLLKTGFAEHGGPYSENVMRDLRPLTSECYWLSCLMALNNPPLQPDWKNHVPGIDSWDIFPRDIKPSVL